MKVAIVPDWITVDGGAEKVLRAIIDIYPHADIFTLVDFLDDEQRETILNGKKATTSFLQDLPFSKKHFRNYLPLFPKAIESLDLKGYDLIISSSWAVAKGIQKGKDQLHICYCHTPIRYAWDMYHVYTDDLPFIKKQIVQLSLQYIKKWDRDTSNRVDYFIANSTFIQQRIRDNYNRDSIVIHPPVNTEQFLLCEEKEDYYITASRLVPYKKTKLIVEAFNKLGKKLIVIGDGEEYNLIKSIAEDNVKVLGFVEHEEMITYMQKAKAFVYAALEDFGIVPIEALSCGTPVIAYGKGGVKDSVVDGQNGLFFYEQTSQSIIDAVKKFETLSFNSKTISNYAKIFSKERFSRQLKDQIDIYLKE